MAVPLNESDGITMLIAIGNETILQFLQAQPTLAIQRDLALISDDDNDLLMRVQPSFRSRLLVPRVESTRLRSPAD